MKHLVFAVSVGLYALTSPVSAPGQDSERTPANWPMIGGTPGNSHYSNLKQINRSNVAKLEVAWKFDTGEEGGLETTPLIIDGVLYGITPRQEIIALDAANGKLLWKFDSGINGTGPDRGLTYWSDGKEKRLLAGVMNFVYALDPATGKVITTFGKNGRIDLREDLGRDPAVQSVALTSPGVLYKDLLIVGGRNPETLPAPPGDIRAYDVRTGALRWSFHTIPHPGEFGYDTWPKDAWKTSGAANNWAGMAVDQQRGIVFVPTGSAAPDFYGATRVGDDLFADSLIALDAATGKTTLALSGRASRHLGQRFSSRPHPRLHQPQRKRDSRRCANHKAGRPLHLQPHHRRSALPHRRPLVPSKHHARRSRRNASASSSEAGAIRASNPHRRHPHDTNTRSARVGRQALPRDAQRRPVRSTQRRQRHARHAQL